MVLLPTVQCFSDFPTILEMLISACAIMSSQGMQKLSQAVRSSCTLTNIFLLITLWSINTRPKDSCCCNSSGTPSGSTSFHSNYLCHYQSPLSTCLKTHHAT